MRVRSAELAWTGSSIAKVRCAEIARFGSSVVKVRNAEIPVPKAAQISEKNLGVYMGASPLAGKFPKAV